MKLAMRIINVTDNRCQRTGASPGGILDLVTTRHLSQWSRTTNYLYDLVPVTPYAARPELSSKDYRKLLNDLLRQ